MSAQKGNRRFGQVIKLNKNHHTKFNPRRRHEVLPWQGTRTVLIAYTPQGLGKVTNDMISKLEDLGFSPPLSQMTEFFLRDGPVDASVKSIEVEEKFENQSAEESVDGYLEVDDGLVKVGASVDPVSPGQPCLTKAEVGFTPQTEKVLSELTGPLEVTHNVSPAEALAELPIWSGAIAKEMGGIEIAIKRLKLGTSERQHRVHPHAQRLPMKMVFTVKPNPKAVISDPDTWYRRKVRLVICGNYAAAETWSLYTEAASSEAVRASLVISRRLRWAVGVIDVVGAFSILPS